MQFLGLSSKTVSLSPLSETEAEVKQGAAQDLSFRDIRTSAVNQPFQKVTSLMRDGEIYFSMARPRLSLTTYATRILRSGWNKVSASRVGSNIKYSINKTLAVAINSVSGFCEFARSGCNVFPVLDELDENADEEAIRRFYSEDSGPAEDAREDGWFTAEDISNWRVPNPSPERLVAFRQTAEKMNRIVSISGCLKGAVRLSLAGINKYYLYKYGELFLELPAVPKEWEELLLGNSSGEYLTFAQRVDKMLIEFICLGDGLIGLPEPEALSRVREQMFFMRLGALFKSDVKRVFSNVAVRTITRTQEKRLALIHALEGMVMRLLYDGVASKLPNREVILREFVITKLAV